MDRITAINIINEYVKSDVLLKHLIGVEAAMRGYAKKLGEDEYKPPQPPPPVFAVPAVAAIVVATSRPPFPPPPFPPVP